MICKIAKHTQLGKDLLAVNSLFSLKHRLKTILFPQFKKQTIFWGQLFVSTTVATFSVWIQQHQDNWTKTKFYICFEAMFRQYVRKGCNNEYAMSQVNLTSCRSDIDS